MTRATIAALVVLAGAGCAHTKGGGVSVATIGAIRPEGAAPRMALTGSTTAPADSAWLTFTAPTLGSWGCEPDSASPLRDYMRVYVLRLKGQAPSWYRGAEADSAAWAQVRRECAPDTVWRAWASPGQRCSLRIGSGQYVAMVERQRCSAWRIVLN